MNHTPGPWFVGEDRANGIAVFWRQDAMICPMRWIDGLHADVVARVEADARLIAAAPELLEALRKLANEAHGFRAMADVYAHGHTNIAVLDERIAIARAIIAKAEGTTP